MFWIFLLFAFIGYLSYLLISLDKFDKQTEIITAKMETVRLYFVKYFFVVILSLLTIIAFSYMVTLDGGQWLIETITDKYVPGNTPFAFHIAAYLFGLLNLIFVKWLFDRFGKPFQINFTQENKQ
jgi:H+/Cl- antiporter ClcA